MPEVIVKVKTTYRDCEVGGQRVAHVYLDHGSKLRFCDAERAEKVLLEFDLAELKECIEILERDREEAES